MAKKLSSVEKAKLAKIMSDPVLWARAFLISNDAATKKKGPWKARDYQEEMLRDNSLRKVYRCGRRCIAGNTNIHLADGNVVPVESLCDKEFKIVALNMEQDKLVETTARCWFNGRKKTMVVSTKGSSVEVTGNHPFLVKSGKEKVWRNASKLSIGDKIAVANNLAFFGREKVPEEDIVMLACFMAPWEKANPEIEKQLDAVLSKADLVYQVNGYVVFNGVDSHIYSSPIVDSLTKEYIEEPINAQWKDRYEVRKRNGSLPKEFIEEPEMNYSLDDDVPSSIMKGTKEVIIRYLRLVLGLNAKVNSSSISFGISPEIDKGIRNLLKKFNVHAWHRYIYEPHVIKDPDSIVNFCRLIGLEGRDEELRQLELRALSNLINKPLPKDYHWEEVVLLSKEGTEDTYDIEVDEHHNFVANDFITHNTGKSETMVVEALYNAYTHNDYRVLFIAPYENQINLAFMRMREFIHDSPLLKMEVTRMINSPYMITFGNKNSAILGFTTGASSNTGAASIRGQRSDLLLLDELDYMGEDDYSTIMMIAGERPDIRVIASSTPTGKRGTFYHICMDPDSIYSEHFHPSTHNPNWSEAMELEFRQQLTDAQYEHEVMAEFGTEEAGVFDKDKLDLARRRELYTYDKLPSYIENQEQIEKLFYDEDNPAPPNVFRCVGVDWDAYQAGSSILVLDFDVDQHAFKVIRRVEVPRGEYTLDRAIEWIIKINQIYNPSWIFCDRGYGDQKTNQADIRSIERCADVIR